MKTTKKTIRKGLRHGLDRDKYFVVFIREGVDDVVLMWRPVSTSRRDLESEVMQVLDDYLANAVTFHSDDDPYETMLNNVYVRTLPMDEIARDYPDTYDDILWRKH